MLAFCQVEDSLIDVLMSGGSLLAVENFSIAIDEMWEPNIHKVFCDDGDRWGYNNASLPLLS